MRRHDGRSRTLSMATNDASERATLHAMSSEYTHGLAARFMRADPPMIATNTSE